MLVRFVNGPDTGKELIIEGSVTIGRAETCDVILADPEVSSSHCIVFQKGKKWFIRDLGSTNGTRINNEVIRESVLKNGDQIFICGTHLVALLDSSTDGVQGQSRIVGLLKHWQCITAVAMIVVVWSVWCFSYFSHNRLWREYVCGPEVHSRIPNCSYAGYAFGEQNIPNVNVVVNVKDLGAKGDGVSDDTAVFVRALYEVGSNGGAILIPHGTYCIADAIRINRSGIVLRGEGPERTILSFKNSLSTLLRPAKEWSWRGGLIWVEPERVDDVELVSGFQTSWIIQDAKQGSTTLRIDPILAIEYTNAVGRMVRLRYKGNKKFAEEIMGGNFVEPGYWTNWSWMTDGLLRWEWINQITAVEGDTLTLKKPLRLDVRREWDVMIGPTETIVTQIGIENLSIRMPVHDRPGHLEDPGFNGVYFHHVVNGWIRNVVIENADNGIILEYASQNTIRKVVFQGQGCHHASTFRYGSHDNLMEDFRVLCKVHHGISVQDLASGNVWRKGWMDHGTFDYHRGMPFDSIRTDIVISNDGRPGGTSTGGPYTGRRIVHWNVNVMTNQNGKVNGKYVYAPGDIAMGAMVGVRGVSVYRKVPVGKTMGSVFNQRDEKDAIVLDHDRIPNPRDLYLAQRNLRLSQKRVQ